MPEGGQCLGPVSQMSRWVDISAIIAATAALWALSLTWLTYVMAIRRQNKDEFLALKSVVEGLRVELDLMRPWTGFGGEGYSKKITAQTTPSDWSLPSRLIWKFDIQAVSTLTSSPYLYRLRDIVVPFAKLNFSVSRLFQLYDEYRSFVNSNPDEAMAPQDIATAPFKNAVFRFNFLMHVNLIGGADSDDPLCLFKTYAAATGALEKFGVDLKEEPTPPWFWAGHTASVLFFLSGLLLFFRLFQV